MANKGRHINRLKKNSDFLDLRLRGQKIRGSDWLQIQFIKSDEGPLLVGVTVSRKVGIAVVRNKLKRWCHEYFNKNRQRFEGLSGRFNFLFRPHNSQNFYKELEHELFDKTISQALKSFRISD
ncbi:MAG: ribonuclease P protein component [Bdellovibrionales bacterium]